MGSTRHRKKRSIQAEKAGLRQKLKEFFRKRFGKFKRRLDVDPYAAGREERVVDDIVDHFSEERLVYVSRMREFRDSRRLILEARRLELQRMKEENARKSSGDEEK